LESSTLFQASKDSDLPINNKPPRLIASPKQNVDRCISSTTTSVTNPPCLTKKQYKLPAKNNDHFLRLVNLATKFGSLYSPTPDVSIVIKAFRQIEKTFAPSDPLTNIYNGDQAKIEDLIQVCLKIGKIYLVTPKPAPLPIKYKYPFNQKDYGLRLVMLSTQFGVLNPFETPNVVQIANHFITREKKITSGNPFANICGGNWAKISQLIRVAFNVGQKHTVHLSSSANESGWIEGHNIEKPEPRPVLKRSKPSTITPMVRFISIFF